MKEYERDYVDDLFREKLYHFEADVEADGWGAIAGRLGEAEPVPLRRAWRYWAAAAAVLLAIVGGGLYVFDMGRGGQPAVAVIGPPRTPAPPAGALPAAQTGPSAPAQKAAPLMAKAYMAAEGPVAVRRKAPAPETLPAAPEAEAPANPLPGTNAGETDGTPVQTRSCNAGPHARTLQTCGRQPQTAGTVPRRRRWGFGMGAGSIGTATSGSLNAYALKSASVADPELTFLNSAYISGSAAKTDIRHKTPFSVDLGISYYLTGRLALQSGLTYTFLSSEWKTNAVYYGQAKQKLHFIGIPLSLSYTFAEWRRVRFYAAAGAMAEVNVAGSLQSRIMVGDDEFRRETESIRMDEWMWSVNARVGAAYPLWRFVSIYAETGMGYYFDNGSDIETIRSEKPFNVSLQAGFRLGF